MLKIGKSYILRTDGTARLCADVTAGNRRTALWFAVDGAQEDCLAPGRADPFVMALLPGAMGGGHEIVCEDPMSERLHYQLSQELIPALAFAMEPCRLIRITAPLTAEKLPNRGAVGTGFSGGVDSLYTVMRHGRDCEFPLTHIAVFHSRAVYDRPSFLELCRQGGRFAAELGLEAVFLDTNLSQALTEDYFTAYTFRNLACALALGGLFSVYLVSSGHSAARLKFEYGRVSRYDPATVGCASTESLAFYLSGAETARPQKLEALAGWEPSWRWLHPCVRVLLGGPNCGRCKKCARDLTALYALGALDRYREVFDVDGYLRDLPRRMGLLLSFEDSQTSEGIVRLLRERNIEIPAAAFAHARQIRRARERLAAKLEERGGTRP